MIASLTSSFNRLRADPAPLRSAFAAISKNIGLLLVLAVALTAMVMMYLWHEQSAYKPVFGAREKVAVADMMSALDTEHIPYRIHPDNGQVLVPEAMLGKVRMLLASKGVTAQLPAGLELMDKNDPLGVSQFVQDVRFRRGLEGELAQSILTIDAVASARVHLSIAKSSSFVASDGEKSSASVMLALKPGRTLTREQTAAILNLVAGSVATLTPQRVSLVDQAGNLLSAHVDLSDGFDATNNGEESARRFQNDTRKNVQELLGPLLGEDNFKVSVTAAVSTDKVDETVEKYGDNPKVTNEAMRDEQDRNRVALGIPGSLSNRPPSAAADATKAGAEADKNNDQGSARKNATTRQYAYDRSVTQIKRGRGRLDKLSVAVVLNAHAAPNPKAGWSAAELAGIDRILRSGLGIDAQRGDNLTVSALNFPPRPATPSWWEERDNIVDIATWCGYALAAVLAFLLIIRPMMKLATQKLSPPPVIQSPEKLLPGATAASPALPAADGVTALPGTAQTSANMPVVPLLESYDLPPPGSAVDVMVDHLRILAAKEPERVAEVVKQWMGKHARAE